MKLYFCYHNVTIKYIKSLTKNIFDRERPTLLRLIDISGFSFPSGHAMGSTSFLEVQCILLSVEHQEVQKASLLDYVRHLFYSFLFQEFI